MRRFEMKKFLITILIAFSFSVFISANDDGVMSKKMILEKMKRMTPAQRKNFMAKIMKYMTAKKEATATGEKV